MINFVPVYPLEIVVYPGEDVRLHIFEHRYKHLITDCYGEDKPFGILSVLNGQVAEFGTLVEISDVVEVWEDGRMNVQLKGLKVFRVLETIREITKKLYSGAIVNYPENNELPNAILGPKIVHSIKELHTLLSFNHGFTKEEDFLLSYDLAHVAGLSLAQEHEMLCLLHESQRLEYLRRHLLKILPLAANISYMSQRYNQKDIFKNLRSFEP